MKTQFVILSTATLLLFILVSPHAEAQRGRNAAHAGRAIRGLSGIGKAPSIRAPEVLGQIGRMTGPHRSSPFPLLDAISRGGGGQHHAPNSPFPLLDALSRASGGHGNNRNGTGFPLIDAITQANGGRNEKHSPSPADLLYGLAQLGGYGGAYGNPGYGGYGGGWGGSPYYDSYYRHKSDESYADAYRDAAIANAVGNVVSAVVSSQSVRTAVPVYSQPAPVYAQPAPVYTQPAPAYVQPSPLGHYETRRQVVSGGYYERHQIWVPDARDPQTGNIIEGHYETVKQWVPEVVQESSVWVAP